MTGRTRIPLPLWLWTFWPFDAQRRAVVSEYVSIGQTHRHFVADVALRGGIFREFDPQSDGDLANFNGRRELALEIVKLCKVDSDVLFASIPKAPREEQK